MISSILALLKSLSSFRELTCFRLNERQTKYFVFFFSVQKFSALATYLRMIGWRSLCLGKWSKEHNKLFHTKFARTLEQIYGQKMQLSCGIPGHRLYLGFVLVQTPVAPYLLLFNNVGLEYEENLDMELQMSQRRFLISWGFSCFPWLGNRSTFVRKRRQSGKLQVCFWEVLGHTLEKRIIRSQRNRKWDKLQYHVD